MFFKLLLTVLIARYIYASSDPVNINGNTITTEKKYINGSPKDGITIGSGAFWSLFVDYSFESKILSVHDYAAFYLSSTKGDITTTVKSIINEGTVAILNPNNLPDVSVEISGEQMVNNGNLFVSGASSLYIIAPQWFNFGTIAISGPVLDALPKVRLQDPESIYAYISNLGDICLTNQYYLVDHQLSGGGCIHLIKTSVLHLSYIDPSDPLDNIIILDGVDARLVYTPGLADYTVAGFGGGNIIEVCDVQISNYSYDDQSGILTIQADNFTDRFTIGTGYNTTDFGSAGLWIYYNGPVPNPTPPQCGVCPSPPTAPGTQ